MPQYIVNPRDDTEAFADVSPEEMQEIVERYHAWTRELAAEGRLQMGHKLRDGVGSVLRGDGAGGMSATDGPYVETKEIIGGFWIIEADDLDDAVQAVSGCPHLHMGNGSLEVREIEAMDD